MKSILDDDLMLQSIEKVKIYEKEEKVILSKINTILNNINYNYDSLNTQKIADIIFELQQKFPTIKKIHFNNIYVMEKNVEKYKLLRKKVEINFTDLKGV